MRSITSARLRAAALPRPAAPMLSSPSGPLQLRRVCNCAPGAGESGLAGHRISERGPAFEVVSTEDAFAGPTVSLQPDDIPANLPSPEPSTTTVGDGTSAEGGSGGGGVPEPAALEDPGVQLEAASHSAQEAEARAEAAAGTKPDASGSSQQTPTAGPGDMLSALRDAATMQTGGRANSVCPPR
ncbi:hypothetical protein HYH03_004099 [Edaphochlamys debaryana]|uniref:Uncharacterized protein n=1 Tax=Edaphochlamys debaryana TaxID=47281 RepID=A0A836C3M4_9CHLO|nr:hypothetical protein HYH03_004099 [Edaphochlamys debaryana]|eukprot:KAG2497829.1 hypothetical protein HYH03_004099 [Edaphochlamys debaryana]